jgi:hypothetical protein
MDGVVEYGKVCEQIGKMYSDLAVLEERKSALERQLRAAKPSIGGVKPLIGDNQNGNGHMPQKRHPDPQAIPKALAYIEELKRGENHTLTAKMLAKQFGVTRDCASMRLRALAKRYVQFKYATGPVRVEW